FCDMARTLKLEDGEVLRDVFVQKAASLLPKPQPVYEWSTPEEDKPPIAAFKAALARDGVTIVDGTIRRVLPVDLGIAAAEDEITRLLKAGPFPISQGLLDQALHAHGRR